MCKLVQTVAILAMIVGATAAPESALAYHGHSSHGHYHGGYYHGGGYYYGGGWGWGPQAYFGGWGYPAYDYYYGPPDCGWAQIRVRSRGRWVWRNVWQCW